MDCEIAGHDGFLGLHGVPDLESHNYAALRVCRADAKGKKGNPAGHVRKVLIPPSTGLAAGRDSVGQAAEATIGARTPVCQWKLHCGHSWWR